MRRPRPARAAALAALLLRGCCSGRGCHPAADPLAGLRALAPSPPSLAAALVGAGAGLTEARRRPRALGLQAARRAEAAPQVVLKKAGRKVADDAGDSGSDADGDEEVCVVNYDGGEEICRPVGGSRAQSVALVRRGPANTYQDWVDSYGKLDPYKVLGLKFLATSDQVREAYVRVCKTEHPDLNGGRESERWLMASRAYRMLTEKGNRYVVQKTAKDIGSLGSALGDLAFALGSLFVGAAAGAAGAAASAAAEGARGAAERTQEGAPGQGRAQAPAAAPAAEEEGQAAAQARGPRGRGG